MKILCGLSTRGRYDNYLAMAIQSVAMQTRKVDFLTIFDDNDEPKDLREIEAYKYLFEMLQVKGIQWQVIYGKKAGQHHNDELANLSGYTLVWRFDDDMIAEPNVLEKLEAQFYGVEDDGMKWERKEVGAVGGSILTPPLWNSDDKSSLINDLHKQNKQWFPIEKTEEVEHLHGSFLYRAGISNFDLRLSRKSFRGETMFTHSLFLKGYKLLITPAVTWHFKSSGGGTRVNVESTMDDYTHDDYLFHEWLKFAQSGKRLAVLDNGSGDHIIFKKLIDEKKIDMDIIACCYPEVFASSDKKIISIQEASRLTDISHYSIYALGDRLKGNFTLEELYIKLYAHLDTKRS